MSFEFNPPPSGGGTWGSITGTLSDQTDLQTALDDIADERVPYSGATAPVDIDPYDLTAANLFAVSNLYAGSQLKLYDGVSDYASFLYTGGAFEIRDPLGALGNLDMGNLGADLGSFNTLSAGTFQAFVTSVISPDIFTAAAKLHIDGGNATASYTKYTAGTTTSRLSTDGFDVGISAAGVGEIRQRENLSLELYTNNTLRAQWSGAGNLFLGGTVQARGAAGSAAIPFWGFESSSDCGMYRATGSTLGFSTTGTARMFIDAAGLIGVGLTSGMAGQLHASSGADATPAIVGDRAVTGGNTFAALFRNSTPSGNGAAIVEIQGRLSGAARPAQIVGLSGGNLAFYTGSTTQGTLGTARMTIGSTGNIGLASATSPTFIFDLQSTSSSQFRVAYNTSNYFSLRTLSTGETYHNSFGSGPRHSFQLNGSEVMGLTTGAANLNGNSFAIYAANGPDSGVVLGADYFAALEAGVYGTNSDEAIATFDSDTGNYYYFNRLLYGSGNTITSSGQFYISTGDAVNPQLTVGPDLDETFQVIVDGTGTVNFYTNSLSSPAVFSFNGDIVLSAKNITTDTSTGMKLCDSTSQKLGFWNATPIIQPTTSVAAASFTANSGTAVNDASTFDGYTIGKVVKALRNAGLLA